MPSILHRHPGISPSVEPAAHIVRQVTPDQDVVGEAVPAQVQPPEQVADHEPLADQVGVVERETRLLGGIGGSSSSKLSG